MPKKLFSIEFGQWEKGMSYETSTMVGGIFKQLTNCDPFEGRGSLTPVNFAAEIGAGVISTSKVIRAILPVYASGTNQFYCLADDYKLYRVDNTAPVVDVSAQIGSGTASAVDLATFKGGLVYAMGGEVRFNAIPVASGSDVQILSASPTSNFVVGADRNGYIAATVATIPSVYRITNTAGTSGNSAVTATFEANNTIRKLINDGYYLVWIGENSTQAAAGRSIITVAFWNMVASTFDQIFEIKGATYGGAELVDDYIKIITSNGIYVTNFSTKPKKVVNFGGSVATTDIPGTFTKVTGLHKDRLFWGTYQSSGNIYQYGAPIFKETPKLSLIGSTATETPTAATITLTALASNNTRFIVASGLSGDSSVELFDLRGGTSSATAIANVAGFSLGKPFTFHSARVITKAPIASGNSVSLQILTANSTKTIKASETKTNTTDPGERVLIFDHTSAGDGSDVNSFDDISDIKLTTNVAINSLEIWGNPVSERGSYG